MFTDDMYSLSQLLNLQILRKSAEGFDIQNKTNAPTGLWYREQV